LIERVRALGQTRRPGQHFRELALPTRAASCSSVPSPVRPPWSRRSESAREDLLTSSGSSRAPRPRGDLSRQVCVSMPYCLRSLSRSPPTPHAPPASTGGPTPPHAQRRRLDLRPALREHPQHIHRDSPLGRALMDRPHQPRRSRTRRASATGRGSRQSSPPVQRRVMQRRVAPSSPRARFAATTWVCQLRIGARGSFGAVGRRDQTPACSNLAPLCPRRTNTAVSSR